MMTMFWEHTDNKANADTLYKELVKFIQERTYVDVIFRKDISPVFAYSLLDSLYNGKIDKTEVKKYIRLKGFNQLKYYSWDNMINAKERVVRENYATCYNSYGYMDGW